MIYAKQKEPIFKFSDEIIEASEKAYKETEEKRFYTREVAFHNQQKVLEAFIRQNIGDHHFIGTTGYGFHDMGREALDKVYADIFNTEAAIVRHSIVSGTHALAAIMHGNLRPGDELLCATGDPYDTIKPIMGIGGNYKGGLDEWNIKTRIVPLDNSNMPDIKLILENLNNNVKMVFLQRSCGYTWRPSFEINILKEIIKSIKEKKPETIIMVDNCYGELVEKLEPTDVGADVMGGSLIKNMGGAVAPTGGYIVGKKEIIDRTANILTCAGIGTDEGATLGFNRLLFQGTFFAPHIVAAAVEGSIWASNLLERLNFETKPRWTEFRTDIIQGIKLGSPDKQKLFCRGIQRACPVDHRATPEAADLPGYRDPILMAGGTFIQGSSIELSCDGPLRPPYAVYIQGGISFEHIRLGVMNAIQEMLNAV
jgi:cystathionine beta-lyase family protein involved in aluminum resistance